MQKTEFDKDTFLQVLDLTKNLSSNKLPTNLQIRIVEFLQEEHTVVEVWNFYKHLLDLCVHQGESIFLVRLFDLEPHYEPPEGALLQSDGSIHSAPWRQSDV